MGYRYPRQSKLRLFVKRGSAGLGLFAGEDIPRNAFVIEYYGPLLTDPEAERKGGKYLFEVSKKWTIDGSPRYNTARYINHSCRPNCYTEIDGRRVMIYAKRAIRAGEELFYNYGTGYVEDFISPDGCKCPACRERGRARGSRKRSR